MLDKLRDPRQNQVLKYFIYAIFAAIIIVFAISFGPGSWGQGVSVGLDHAAVVNGTIITTVEMEQSVGNYLERYRQVTGQPLDDEQIRSMGVRSQVLDSLVERELIAQVAPKHGVRVSDDELRKYITEIDAFHTDGRFDADLYKRYVTNALGLAPAKFEARVRKDLVREKMMLALKQTVKVSDAEVERAWRSENDKVDLEYIRFSPIQFKDARKPTDEEIDQVLADRRAEVEEFYERNKFRYQRPKRVRARHVLIKTDGDVDKDAARKRAEEVLAKAKAGDDFAGLAEQFSEDAGSKERGGDLNWFGPGSMVKPFEEAAFALAPGEISDVVESKFGFHVIKVEEVKEEQNQPLEEVEREVAGLVVEDEMGKTAAKEKADEILAAARAGQTLTAIAPPPPPVPPDADPSAPAPPRPKFSATQTGLVNIQGAYVPGIGRDEGLARAIKELTAASPLVPEVLEISGAYYVVRLAQKQEPDPARFDEEKTAVRERLMRAKQRDVEKSWLESLKETADIQVNQAIVAGA